MTQPPSRRTIVEWTVRLAGEEALLAFMAQVFPGPDPSIRIDGGYYYLRSQEFGELTEPQDVMVSADSMLERMCGILNLYGNYIGKVWAENAVWIDDQGRSRGIGASLRMDINVVNPHALSYLQQPIGPGSHTVAMHLLALASEDAALAALFEAAGGHTLSWADIYILFELLCERCGGLNGLRKLGNVSRNELTRLRRTANDHRHAEKGTGFRPMTRDEASILICRLSCLWTDEQLNQ